MKKVCLAIVTLAFSGFMANLSANCKSLMQKYDAPDPQSKTMAQISRWVSKKVDDAAEAKQLESCMIAQAADNPNKEQVAGR